MLQSAGDCAIFPERDCFVQLNSGGLLSSPEASAGRVLAYLARADLCAQPVADVRD